MPNGRLEALAIRGPGTAGPRQVDSAIAVTATGLAGDRHADPLSPRQLLLAGSAAYARLGLAPHALRENLLLDLDTSLLRSGTVLQVGLEVKLRLMFQCEACGRLDLRQPGLAARAGPQRGMLARVLAGGTVRVGDPVRALGLMPAWSDDWRERVAQVLDAVPDGSVVAYRDLARLAGIQSSYCRAFPRLLARLGPDYARKAVAAGAAPSVPRWDGKGLYG